MYQLLILEKSCLLTPLSEIQEFSKHLTSHQNNFKTVNLWWVWLTQSSSDPIYMLLASGQNLFELKLF